MNRLFSIFNPFSSKYNSLQNFKKLKRPQKIAIGVISSAVAIVTLPIFGIGICLGTAIFRSLTERSISKKSNEDKDAKKISDVLNRSLTLSSPKIDTYFNTPKEFIRFLFDSEQKFPERKIIVTGDLGISFSDIKKLPKKLKVTGYLDASFTDISELPEGIKVGGNLNLSFTKIKKLPEELKVGGNLNLSFTKISELPEGLKVGGNLDLSGTDISELPNWIKELGAKKDGKTRIIDLSNTKLSDDIITKLKKEDIPGIEFHFE